MGDYNMIKPTRKDAIRKLSRTLHPNVGLTIFGDGSDFNKIVLDDSVEKKFSSSDIDTKYEEMTSEWEANQYQRDRLREYPTIAELTVALYDTDDKADIEAKRAAVKAKYPKPE